MVRLAEQLGSEGRCKKPQSADITDAYGNTPIFTAPGTDGQWFTDDDVQSSYGANEIIYCGYRFDPESELYYVRNRTYSPPLGRWLQRDPIGYAGGVNLYEYVGGRAVTEVDPEGTVAIPMPRTIPQAAVEAILAAILAAYLLNLARQAAKKKCEPREPKCNPCIPPAGTICITRIDIVPPSKPHYPLPGSHAHLLIVRQTKPPQGCKCYLNSFGEASLTDAAIYPPCPPVVGGGGVG